MLRAKRNFSSLAIEQIAFQKDNFGKDIELLVSQIHLKMADEYKVPSMIASTKEGKNLATIIKKRLGFNVTLITGESVARCLPALLPGQHALVNDVFKSMLDNQTPSSLTHGMNGKKGYVDTKNAKVSGIFSEVNNLLYINFHILKSIGIDAAGTAAIILHELGHIFTAFEFADRMSRTNQVLSNAAQEAFGKNAKGNKEYIFSELKSLDITVTDEQLDRLTSGDRIIAGKTWYEIGLVTVTSELNNQRYNQTSYEQLSDSFSTRFGYGKQNILAMEAVKGKGYFEELKAKSAPELMLYTLGIIFGVIMPIYYCLVSVKFLLISAITYTLVLIIKLQEEDEWDKLDAYDSLKRRYIRIRNDMIGFLKDNNIPKETVKEYVDSISIIDKITDSKSDFPGIVKSINILMSSRRRADYKSVKHQQQLEDLVNNQLFVSAAKLRTI